MRFAVFKIHIAAVGSMIVQLDKMTSYQAGFALLAYAHFVLWAHNRCSRIGPFFSSEWGHISGYTPLCKQNVFEILEPLPYVILSCQCSSSYTG